MSYTQLELLKQAYADTVKARGVDDGMAYWLAEQIRCLESRPQPGEPYCPNPITMSKRG
jgi:hypothetical protein